MSHVRTNHVMENSNWQNSKYFGNIQSGSDPLTILYDNLVNETFCQIFLDKQQFQLVR